MPSQRLCPGVIAILGLILLASGATGPAGHPSPHPGSIAGEEVIRAEGPLEQIDILASPQMEGRATGTSGGGRAAAHIAEEFRKIGLQPLGNPDTELQALEVPTGVRLGNGNSLALELVGEQKTDEVR